LSFPFLNTVKKQAIANCQFNNSLKPKQVQTSDILFTVYFDCSIAGLDPPFLILINAHMPKQVPYTANTT
jgi:hypothetical protein